MVRCNPVPHGNSDLVKTADTILHLQSGKFELLQENNNPLQHDHTSQLGGQHMKEIP